MSKKIILLFCLSLFFCSISNAQQKTITGTVNDRMGPLPGASILEKGTNNGVTTDFNGNFSLTVSGEDAKLVVNFLGFAAQEIAVRDKIKITIVLEENAEALNEVVVNSLGLEVNKRTLGSTYTKVTADQLANSGETSVINSLQGKASGVRIARANGDPGAGSNIQIRGANTIYGNSQPLIILDGVPISNDNLYGNSSNVAGTSQQSRLNDINEDDIESVTVLKGASAAAVWGSEAANGVLVITTKKGRKTGKINVEFKSTVSFDKIAQIHPLQSNYGQGTGGVFDLTSVNSWGDKIATRSGLENEYYTKAEKGYFVGEDGLEYLMIKTKNSKNTYIKENQDKVFQNATSVKNNLSFGNANEDGNYRVSIGSIDQKGFINESDYKKTNIGFNGKYIFNPKMSITTKLDYAHTESNRIQQNSSIAGLLLGLLRGAPDFDISEYIGDYYDPTGKLFPKRQRSYRNSIGESSNPGYNNPLWTLYKQKAPNEVDRFIFSTDLNYKVNQWLSLKLRGSYDTYNDERRYFSPVNSASFTAGSFRLDNINNKILNLDVIAQTKTFALSNNINGNFILGYNFNDRDRKSVYNEGTNFLINSMTQSFANVSQLDPTVNLTRKIASYRTFVTSSFDFKKQLFLNTSVALEKASSMLGSFIYPSVDASWVFSDLKIFENSKILSSGKIRTGVGQVGVKPNPQQFQTTYQTPIYDDYDDPLNLFLFGGGFSYNSNLGNRNLKPEIKTEYEIGADLKFFNNRFVLGGTYYFNTIVNVLLDIPLTPSTGANYIYGNGGSLQNKGLEFDFDLQLLKSKNGLNAAVYGNFNKNKNEVTDIQGATSLSLTSEAISSRAVIGQQLGTLWGTRALRNTDGTLNLDSNGFPQLDTEQGVIGDPNPDWRGGFGFKADYKGFFANIMFETSQGGDFAERTRFILGSFGTSAEVGNEVTPSIDIKDRAGVLHLAGVPVRGNIRDFGAGPVLLNEAYYTTIGGGFGASVINEFAVNNNASWTRLSELTFGYSLNSKSFKKKTKLASMTFTLTGRNLAIWTDILGIDPQTNQTGVGNGFGIDYFTNPASKTYLFTLQIKY
jgi:TonB-linked SusC/RagA family outer membrane protein